jgi:predicted transcriptional regulator
MEQLWRAGESSVRAVMEALNARAEKPRAYTTYMTVMARLHTKGLLRRRREGKTDFYVAVHAREEYLKLRARAEVDQLIEQYGELALSHFAQRVAELDPARREALERLGREETN